MRPYGIPFYVLAYAFELGVTSDPVIKGFGLPKRFSGASQFRICMAGCHAFDGIGDPGQSNSRLQQDVHVIWHDHVRIEDEMFELSSLQYCGFGETGDRRIG
jgi:hypothetical protein